jgi:hypothetical protein
MKYAEIRNPVRLKPCVQWTTMIWGPCYNHYCLWFWHFPKTAISWKGMFANVFVHKLVYFESNLETSITECTINSPPTYKNVTYNISIWYMWQ